MKNSLIPGGKRAIKKARSAIFILDSVLPGTEFTFAICFVSYGSAI